MATIDTKTKAIRNVKEKLAKVKVEYVAKQLNWSRQNIYYHLNEARADNVNLDILLMISGAIDEVMKLNKKKEDKKLNALI